MAITATRPTASRITASPITAESIQGGDSGGDQTEYTFENGILNEDRPLYDNQPFLAGGTPYIDSEDWADPENWND